MDKRKTVKTPAMVGAKVVAVRRATGEEMDLIAIDGCNVDVTIIELDNGIRLCALADTGGSAYGHLIGLHGKTQFHVFPEQLPPHLERLEKIKALGRQYRSSVKKTPKSLG